MPFSIKKSQHFTIPEISITLLVFILGCIFSLYIFFSVKSTTGFISGFQNPLMFSLYYLWVKALVVDIQRIRSEKEQSSYFPGFVYFIYISQWMIYWMIHDMALSSSQLSSALGGNTTKMVTLYLSDPSFFLLILDIVSSVLLFPLRYILTNTMTTQTFLLLDYLKFLLTFIIFVFVSIF